jgi:DNA-binding CsgD family transcriptional regulator
LVLLTERTWELSSLFDRLGSASSGAGGVSVVSGVAGVGKSALLHAGGDMARALGMRVVFAGDSRAGGPTSVDVVADVRQFLHDHTGTEAPTDPAELAAALVAVSTEIPLLIAVDDVNRTGCLSLQLLRGLLPHLRHSAIALLISLRWQEKIYHMTPSDVLGCFDSHRFSLGTLSVQGVREAARNRLGAEPEDELVARVYAMSGGNPAVMQVAFDDILDSADGRAPRYFAYHQAVRSLVRAHEMPELAAVAEAAAVLREQSSVDLLACLLNLNRWTLQALLDYLDIAGLLDHGAVCREPVRVALLATAATEDAARLHLRAAELLYDSGARADEVAHHLLMLGTAPAPWAVAALREAGTAAVARGEFRAAALLLRLAARCSTSHSERSEIEIQLLETHWWDDSTQLSRTLSALSSAARAGGLSGKSLSKLARALTWQGMGDEAVVLVEQGMVAPDLDSSTTIDLAISEFWIRHVFPGARLSNDSRAGIEELTPEIIAGAPPWFRLARELAALLASGRHEDVAECAREIIQHVTTHFSDLKPLCAALFSLMAVEQFDLTEKSFAKLVGDATDAWPPRSQTALRSMQAVFEFNQGRVQAALDLSTEALRQADNARKAPLTGLQLGIQLLALTELGLHEQAAAVVEIPMPAAFARSPYGLVYLRARGRHHLATGGLHAALSDFRTCGEILRSWRLELPGLVPWRLDIAETLIAMDRRAEAESLVHEQLAIVPSPRSRTRAIALRLQAVLQPAQRRSSVLRESATVLERCGNELELARTLAQLAQCYQSEGNLTYGRSTMRRAEKLAGNCGGKLALAEMSAQDSNGEEVVELGQGEKDAVRLTTAEAKVVRLATQGYTNREIAVMLYVTISTVEQHLTRIYRKFSVRRRSELCEAAMCL